MTSGCVFLFSRAYYNNTRQLELIIFFPPGDENEAEDDCPRVPVNPTEDEKSNGIIERKTMI